MARVTGARTDDDAILCACAAVRRGEVRAALREPGGQIGDFMERTGLGKKCTACALDLDLILDEELSTKPAIQFGPTAAPGSLREGGFLNRPVSHIDSGFFLNSDGVETTLRVGNYHAPFEDPLGIADQNYRIVLYGPSGSRLGAHRGLIPKGESLSFPFAEYGRGVPHGWFALTVWATDLGHAGTIRPQVTFKGAGWTSSYHTQLHIFASRSGRRSGVCLRTRDGRTRAGVSVINAGRTPARCLFRLEIGTENREAMVELPPRGAEIFRVDPAFPNLPAQAPVLLRVESSNPTRKNVIFFSEEGRISADHFPNLC